MISSTRMKAVRIYPSAAGVIQGAAERIALLSEQAFSTRGRFTIALSGGSTPRELYDLLATREFARRFDWATTYIFWGDERGVPPESRDSNYHLAVEALLNRVPIPHANIFRIHGELPPQEAATRYDQVLHEFFVSRLHMAETRFDVVLLGIGADGHTASLFPNTVALGERERWAVTNRTPAAPFERVTLTYPVLNAAANLFFLVTGAEKADAVARTLSDGARVNDTPAAGIQLRRGDLRWLIDEPAAVKLPRQDDSADKLRQTFEMMIAKPSSAPASGDAATPPAGSIKPLSG